MTFLFGFFLGFLVGIVFTPFLLYRGILTMKRPGARKVEY